MLPRVAVFLFDPRYLLFHADISCFAPLRVIINSGHTSKLGALYPIFNL